MKISTAYANANIALVKYWGKACEEFNIPAAASLSMTLDNFGTRVSIKPSLGTHKLVINNKESSGRDLERLNNFLELIRSSYNYKDYFELKTFSSIPYSAGLASSAAFFAALSKALDNYLDLNLSDQELSILARRGSGSAARSIFGGFSALKTGLKHEEAFAYAIKPSEELKLAMLVAIVDNNPKALSSREAMILTKNSSPYYEAWLKSAEADFKNAHDALEKGSFELLGAVLEHSALKMHASMWAALPPINYLMPQSLALIELVKNFRKNYGPHAFFTMDAGPNVKILCESAYVEHIKDIINKSKLCNDIRVSSPGLGAFISHEHVA